MNKINNSGNRQGKADVEYELASISISEIFHALYSEEKQILDF